MLQIDIRETSDGIFIHYQTDDQNINVHVLRLTLAFILRKSRTPESVESVADEVVIAVEELAFGSFKAVLRRTNSAALSVHGRRSLRPIILALIREFGRRKGPVAVRELKVAAKGRMLLIEYRLVRLTFFQDAGPAEDDIHGYLQLGKILRVLQSAGRAGLHDAGCRAWAGYN